MRRREFIGLLGSVAVAWPLGANAQQAERVRRIAVLLPAAANDPDYRAWFGAFLQALAQSGWTIGRNARIDTRWGANAAEVRKHAAELVALSPDVILSHGAGAVAPLLQATRTVPIVFPIIADPVAAGFVDSLARPGGNATDVTRVAVLGDPATPTGPAQFGFIQAAAPSLKVEVNTLNRRDAGDIERAVATFAQTPNGSLIVTPGSLAQLHRDLIVKLAARHKLPAMYFDRLFVDAGGLASYAPDRIEMYRSAAGYVDRILKGEKPAEMPVQAQTKYD